METPDEKWFRERLRHFLEIRHPPRQFHHVMIERRSRLAFESYAQSVELGVPASVPPTKSCSGVCSFRNTTPST